MTKSQAILLQKLSEYDGYFKNDTQYKSVMEMAHTLFTSGQYSLCEKSLKGLPTRADLLASLMEKLKGKSAYKTLRKIQEGKTQEVSYETLKGLSSLMTHAVISCEQGEMRYKRLLPYIAEKIDELIYQLQG